MYAPSEARRGRLALLFSAPFGPYFWGKILWTLGVWIHSLVAAILAFDVTRSALFVGAVTAAQFLPQLLFTPLAGAWADKGNVKRQIVWGRLLNAIGSAALATTALATDNPPGIAIVASSLCVGIGLVVGGPAIQSIVPGLVRPEHLADAVALNSMPLLVARAAAPAFGAFLYSAAGPGIALLAAASGSVGFALAIAVLHLPAAVAVEDRTDATIRAGWRFVRQNRAVGALLLGVTALGFGADPSMTLTPSIATMLGGGATLVGSLGSTFGAGATVGFVLLSPLRRRMGDHALGPCGLTTMAASLVLLGASQAVPVAMVAFALGGMGMTIALTSITTLLHEATPEHLRGRVMAYWLMGFMGSRPLASMFDGVVADRASVPTALFAVAGLTALGAAACRPARTRTGTVGLQNAARPSRRRKSRGIAARQE